MPSTVRWLREPDDQHTGSVELQGLGAAAIVLYAHPVDESHFPIASPCARWEYDLQDLATRAVAADSLDMSVRGFVSYERFADLWRQYQAASWVSRTDPFQGQANSAATLGTAVIATGLQPSGGVRYAAYLSCTPAEEAPRAVQVTAALKVRAFTTATLNARLGGGRSVDAAAKVMDGTNDIARIRINCRVRWPFAFKYRSQTVVYPVVIPPGGSVLIGEVFPGLAYVIKRGRSRFIASSEIRFSIT